MTFPWKRAAMWAAVLYLALFALAFVNEWRRREVDRTVTGSEQSQQESAFTNARKNYASAKMEAVGPATQPIGNSQKYEKIASLTQRSTAFDSDRARVEAGIMAHQGIVQVERGSGLKGKRVLHMGIGVPPEKFDSFIEAMRGIGATALIATVKNDKTNEYLQLRAKRASLEKTRTALDALQGSGGSVDERIHVQNELTTVEEKIQELGVSLGDFDSQNELCTVKLTLEEAKAPRPAQLLPMVVAALAWAALVYAGIGGGFITLIASAWGLFWLVAKVRAATAAK